MQKQKSLKNTFREWFPAGGSYCFYCQADSEELKGFLILVIGGLFLASVFVFIAFYLRGHFNNVETIKDTIFESEERE